MDNPDEATIHPNQEGQVASTVPKEGSAGSGIRGSMAEDLIAVRICRDTRWFDDGISRQVGGW